jgi:hypothetical protein
MNGTDEKTETIRIEWGHRIEWPDGHSEFNRDKDRDSADWAVRSVNGSTVNNGKTATVQTRTVTTSPWTQV